MPTACIGVCERDAAGLCAGRRRSGGEIACWPHFTHAQRRHRTNVVLPRRAPAEPPA
ncbi:MAG: DUF1289 domain-containing protein [Proteobacteria bacterium]|nr:DUF1289 domain-containing protein [Pseudomonadota bacterium]